MKPLVPTEVIERKILLIRGQKVMLDVDLAKLYEVETKVLNRAVKRNKDRFPEDFMSQLKAYEFENLRFHFGTSSWGGRRYLPFAFTEQGVAMLSCVLQSNFIKTQWVRQNPFHSRHALSVAATPIAQFR